MTDPYREAAEAVCSLLLDTIKFHQVDDAERILRRHFPPPGEPECGLCRRPLKLHQVTWRCPNGECGGEMVEHGPSTSLTRPAPPPEPGGEGEGGDHG